MAIFQIRRDFFSTCNSVDPISNEFGTPFVCIMKSFAFGLLAPALASAALNLPRAESGFSAEQYESGYVHEVLMQAKLVSCEIVKVSHHY